MYLRQVYPLPLSLSYPFKHESICLLNYHLTLFSSWMWTSLQRTSLSSLLSVRSLLSPRLHCTLFVPVPSVSPSLSLSRCHITIWLPSSGEWSVFMAVVCLPTVADTLRARWGIVQKQSAGRWALSSHTYTNQRWMSCLDTPSCLTAPCTHLHISPVHSAWQRGLTSSHALSTGFGGESTHPHIEDRAFMHPLLERTCFYLWCCCILNPFLGQSIFFFLTKSHEHRRFAFTYPVLAGFSLPVTTGWCEFLC